MWLAVASFTILFALAAWVIPGMTWGIWWKIQAAGILCSTLCVTVFDLLIRRDLSRRESAINLIDRVAQGDLTMTARRILDATHSTRMSAAVRALVSNLDRTIRRFSQLSADVERVTDQMTGRSRILARGAGEQLESTERTTGSVTQIDQSINAVRTSMQRLSSNAEQTSTSILEMSASIEEVGRIADTLSQFVDETATAFEEMTASIGEVASNTESFSSFATQTASSIVQMNATTAEIGRSARQSADLARFVADAATEGRSAVGGTVEGMRKIEQSVEEAKLALGELGGRSQEIGDIVRVIDDIARQTNLLALNAAIIAAQAGDRGKGFAVVADEIRDLSERTSTSTEEIRTLIQNVQRSVDRAAEQMTLSADRVSDGVGLTERASQVLEKILELTSRSTSSIAEIAKATDEQSRGSAAATEAIEQVTRMVQQTASATQQQSQTARKVGEQAGIVRDYTRHLKRAMAEQESGSRAISGAMQDVAGLVAGVVEATSILATESAAIVKAMNVIEQGSREASFGVGDLNQMASALTHEATLLNQELSRFSLGKPSEGGHLTTATILWQQLTFDPIYTTAAALGFMAKAVHQKLVSYGEGAELRPELAERWEILDQGLHYRLHLRRGVKFHSGREVEASDVYESLLRLVIPENKSPGSWAMRNVRGAEDVLAGKSRQLSGVVATDRHTVDIYLDQPVAFFLSLLSMHECGIVPVEETRDADRMRLRPAGAGPFRIAEVVEGQRVRLVKNREYWAQDQPLLDEVTFRLDLRSAREVADAFMRGELDIIHGIPLRIVAELQKNPLYAPYLLTQIQLHTSYLAFDSSAAPFDRLEVRQAMNYAINRDRINETVFAGLGLKAQSLLPPGLIGYDSALRGFDYDPERARVLLRQAGVGNGFEVQYRTWETDEFRNSGQLPLIIEDLAEVGVRVDVTEHSTTDARAPLQRKGHGSLFCGNWYADFPDPDNFFFIFFHSHSNAVPGLHYHRDDLDRQIEEARMSNDVQERIDIYRSLDARVVREAPLVPLFHDRLFVLHKPHVRGVRTSLAPPPVRFHDVWCERES
jgi:peptide/nickel transport system substrate-binding protein